MPDEIDLAPGELEYNAETDRYRVQYSNTSMPPSIALVDAVSQIEEMDPVELKPLNAVLDPDAFDSILQWEKAGDRTLQFTYEGYDVLAQSYGVIELAPHAETY